jgi:hypothetical protein
LVFGIDVGPCIDCGEVVKAMACIEDSVVINKILDHLSEKMAPEPPRLLPQARAPHASLFWLKFPAFNTG